ncbi:MAG TPA: hypothetical protein VF476_08935 [Chitinophagaceae bacterium]
MKSICTIGLVLLFSSCFNDKSSTTETEQLKQRIIRLEERIDSLTNVGNSRLIESQERNSDSFVPYGTVQKFSRCQAITRKGAQCKRAAKGNGYCWQHRR